LRLLALQIPIALLVHAAPLAAQEAWTATSTTEAPIARYGHMAVWTGSRMIVWGGFVVPIGYLNTGGIYDPATDRWVPTSRHNAPTARRGTAVWTSSKMIVWGGWSEGLGPVNTGGVYDPATDSWTPTSMTNAPAPRSDHTAVWTGSRMIVWGGGAFNTGGVYDPSADSWTATSTTSAPAPRSNHTAVWTGSRMIVWGGGAFNTGGVYDPVTDTWTATSTTSAPSACNLCTAIWTGLKMIVWGGYVSGVGHVDTGGIYDPVTDTWTATSTTNAPSGRHDHTAVWTGSRMIVWGGYGGFGVGYVDTGGIYDPVTDTWAATSTTIAPAARRAHRAAWTGSQMIVWGGTRSGSLDTGGVYANPSVVPTAPPPAGFFTVLPCRLVDTRNAVGPSGGPALYSGATRAFPVTGGVCGVPSTAIAVSVNVTAVGAATQGHLTLYRGDVTSPPPTSTITFSAGQARGNNAIVPLGTNVGTINVKNGSAGSVHLVLDVNGYFQ
jgi:N-acetylneuraminic acid mutarotase